MERIATFYGSLKKSTRLTVASCAGFVLLTLLVLLFFVRFPITPSEKIMTSIGRESIHRQDDGNGGANAVASVETSTAQEGAVTTATAAAKTKPAGSTVSTSHTNYVITVTMGSGFVFYSGRIPIAIMPGVDYSTTTTAAADPTQNGDVPQDTPTDAPNDWSSGGGTGWSDTTGWTDYSGGWNDNPATEWTDNSGTGWTDNSGGWTDNSGGWTDNSGGWTDNSGGWTDNSGGWTDNSGGWNDYSGDWSGGY